jgi:hypothetical protein
MAAIKKEDEETRELKKHNTFKRKNTLWLINAMDVETYDEIQDEPLIGLVKFRERAPRLESHVFLHFILMHELHASAEEQWIVR